MNRDKAEIGRVALSLAVVALIFALGSCTQEPIRLSMPGGDGMMVRVTFPNSVATRATTGGTEVGTGDENRLDRVTILVFNEDGTKLETVLSENVTATNGSLDTSQPQWALQGTLLVSPIENPASPKKIYAIANWDKPTSYFDKTTYTEAMLKGELTTIAAVADINGINAYPMLMSGSKEVPSLSSVSYSVTVDMERQASKIKTLFTMPIDVQNKHPQIEWQTDLMKITVVNVPDKSYVIGRGAVPPDSTLLNSLPIAVDDIKPAADDQTTVPATKELKWSESVYINENPVIGITEDSKAACTCIVVQLPYKNRITDVVDMDNYYQLYLNDTRDADSPHKVVRNTIYTLNVQILGMGLPFSKLIPEANVVDELTVNSWEKGEMGDVEFPNNYFNIDRTYLEFQSFETLLQSNIVTDVTDWKLVKEDDTTLLSFAEGKITETLNDITYTLSGSASNATVTVDRPAEVVNFPTHQMTFIAKNLKVPFTVVPPLPVGSYIPTSALIAAGWVNNLPPNGLQVATRGNGVLPGGVAGSDDPQMQWKETPTSTSGTAAGLGMGVSSTDAMVANAILHLAAQYCRDMGKRWFLPSKEELLLIYRNQATLGASYKFTANSYWSATDGTYNNTSWIVNFTNGDTVNYYKTNGYRVRCVRAI